MCRILCLGSQPIRTNLGSGVLLPAPTHLTFVPPPWETGARMDPRASCETILLTSRRTVSPLHGAPGL